MFSSTSIQFDGLSKYAKMGDVHGFEYSDPFSVSCWVKTTSTGCLMSKLDSTPTGYGVFVGSSGEIRFVISSDATHKMEIYTTASGFDDGNWHHICCAWNGCGLAWGMSIYVDGELQPRMIASDTLLSGSILNAAEFNIAGNNNGSNLLACNVVLIAVHDKCLSATDASRLYNRGNTYDLNKLDTQSNLVGWWNPLVRGDLPEVYDFARLLNGESVNMDMATNVSSDTPGGVSSKSLLFNGTDEYLKFGNVCSFERTTAFSVSFWLKTTTTSGGYVISKFNSTPTGWGAYLDNASPWGIRFYLVNSSTNRINVYSSTDVHDGSWHHVLVCYDGSSSAAGVTMWVDGVSQVLSITTNALTATIVNTNDLNIGCRTNGSLLLSGRIDEVSVYQTNLGASDATALYNSGSPVDVSTLSSFPYAVAWWGMGDRAVSLSDEAKYPTVVSTELFGTSYYRQQQKIGNPMIYQQATSQWADAMSFYPGVAGTFSIYSTRLKSNVGSYSAGPVATFTINDIFSASIWFKTTATGPKYLMGSTNGGYDLGVGWALYMIDGKLKWGMCGGNYEYKYRARCDTLYNDGAWHHVVASRGGTLFADTKMYVDGVEVTLVSEWYANNTSGVYTYHASVGTFNNSVTSYSWDGWISDAAIYTIALDLTQVGEIYNGGVPNNLLSLSTASDIMHWWPFGSTPDPLVTRNATMSSINGTNISSDTPGGITKNSIEFKGTGYLSVGNNFRFERDQPFSWSGWFKTDNVLRTAMVLWNKIDSTNAGYNAWVTSAGSIYTIVGSTNTNKVRKGTTTTGFNDGSWHHVCVTYDGGSLSAGLKIYVDGSLQPDTTTDDNLTASILDTASLTFGGRPDPTGADFIGLLAEFSLYGKELSGGEVSEIYNSGSPADPASLTTQPYLLAYWPFGIKYNPATLVALEMDDVTYDVPYFSDLATTKAWTTVANYLIGGGGESSLNTTRRLLLDMKNKLVAYAGWTVIGSANGTIYEYEGDTGGGSYGGDSTGPYDVWEDYLDIVWRDSDSGQGISSWAVLRSPLTAAGQFWLLLWHYSSNDYYIRSYAFGVKPTLRDPPLELAPFVTSGQPWHYVVNNIQLWDYINTSNGCRTYFSGCPSDGSFIFARQSPSRGTYWSAMQMFHVVTEDTSENWTMKSVGYGQCWTIYPDGRILSGFYCHLPEEGHVAAAMCNVIWDSAGGTSAMVTMDATDGLTNETAAFPAYVQTNQYSGNSCGGSVIVGRLTDIFLSPTAVGRGAMAPEQSPYKYMSFEGYFWMPGDVEPVF